MMAYKCKHCGDYFTGEEISEMRADHEEFHMHPFICPDCWDRIQRMDLEDQLEEAIEHADVCQGRA